MQPGVLSAALAYVCWGLFPLYFSLLDGVGAGDIVAHRVVWSAALVLVLLAARRQWRWLRGVLREPRVLGAAAGSALLLSVNWLVWVWAVAHGRVVDASLGYFITPLVNVLLGRVVLKERLPPAQWAAVALAGAGVAWLAVQGGELPWIALVLGCSFGVYGLLRKTAALGALEGLALETWLLVPAALAWLAWSAGRASDVPAAGAATMLLLAGLGPVTALPLLLFAAGARRIRLATLGLLQYLAPSLQFMLGVWLYHEPFDAARLVGFGLIWLALLVYSAQAWRRSRARSA